MHAAHFRLNPDDIPATRITLHSVIRSIESFCARPSVRSAILALMLVPTPGLNTHAKIELDVFLRLTSMDVCCGPPQVG